MFVQLNQSLIDSNRRISSISANSNSIWAFESCLNWNILIVVLVSIQSDGLYDLSLFHSFGVLEIEASPDIQT